MRLLVWILGVACTLEALMTARAVAPAWAWLWWSFLGLWLVVGMVVTIVALVRVAAGKAGQAVMRPGAAARSTTDAAQKGE